MRILAVFLSFSLPAQSAAQVFRAAPNPAPLSLAPLRPAPLVLPSFELRPDLALAPDLRLDLDLAPELLNVTRARPRANLQHAARRLADPAHPPRETLERLFTGGRPAAAAVAVPGLSANGLSAAGLKRMPRHIAGAVAAPFKLTHALATQVSPGQTAAIWTAGWGLAAAQWALDPIAGYALTAAVGLPLGVAAWKWRDGRFETLMLFMSGAMAPLMLTSLLGSSLHASAPWFQPTLLSGLHLTQAALFTLVYANREPLSWGARRRIAAARPDLSAVHGANREALNKMSRALTGHTKSRNWAFEMLERNPFTLPLFAPMLERLALNERDADNARRIVRLLADHAADDRAAREALIGIAAARAGFPPARAAAKTRVERLLAEDAARRAAAVQDEVAATQVLAREAGQVRTLSEEHLARASALLSSLPAARSVPQRRWAAAVEAEMTTLRGFLDAGDEEAAALAAARLQAKLDAAPGLSANRMAARDPSPLRQIGGLGWLAAWGPVLGVAATAVMGGFPAVAVAAMGAAALNFMVSWRFDTQRHAVALLTAALAATLMVPGVTHPAVFLGNILMQAVVMTMGFWQQAYLPLKTQRRLKALGIPGGFAAFLRSRAGIRIGLLQAAAKSPATESALVPAIEILAAQDPHPLARRAALEALEAMAARGAIEAYHALVRLQDDAEAAPSTRAEAARRAAALDAKRLRDAGEDLEPGPEPVEMDALDELIWRARDEAERLRATGSRADARRADALERLAEDLEEAQFDRESGADAEDEAALKARRLRDHLSANRFAADAPGRRYLPLYLIASGEVLFFISYMLMTGTLFWPLALLYAWSMTVLHGALALSARRSP